jgi:WD40 repeat protein
MIARHVRLGGVKPCWQHMRRPLLRNQTERTMTEHAITQWLEGLGLGQYADAFRSEQIDLQALPSLTEEHLERLGVAAMGHRVRMLQAIAELDSAPADAAALRDLVQRLPTPVALPLAEYVAEADPRIKLWSACDAVEDLLRLLVFLGVGELSRLSSGPSQALPDGLRRSIQRMIEAPTLGSWRRMAEEVARQASEVPTDDSALPELLSSVVETLAPLLDGPAGERTPERSFLVMRNRLAHGSIGRAQSAKLLTIWQPDFEALWLRFAWLTDLHLVVRRSEGFGVLRGPTTSPLPFEPEAQPGAATLPIVQRLEEQLGSAHSVLALRGEHIIPLWPLALFDVPQHPFEPTEPDTPPLPQVYARLGQVNLQYHPLGDTGILQSEPADEAGKERFLALFRPSAPRPQVGKPAGFTVKGFEESFRSLAPRLIGREPERAALRRALDEMPSGVLWLDGPAGMGKSYLVAHLADELLRLEHPDTLVLGYQFRADDARCARDPFLRFAIERIAAFLGQNTPSAEENTKPLNRLKSLIDALADGSEGGRRLIFLLDGLDEIADRDRGFVADIPLAIRGPSLTWLCAGRPEQGLPEAFAAAGATRVFPEGLPPMSTDDIRAMLMAYIGPLRKTLLRRDTEDGERIANPFVDKVARLSEGLPLYVKYVVGDILARRYRVLDAGETLPPGLDAYHAELIRRLGIGDLQQVLTPLAATLAVAWEPLPVPALADLLCRRTLVPEGEPGLALIRKALGLIQSMIRAARTPVDRDGRDEPGYVLYHHSLAQHMAESAACTHSVAEARRSLAEQAKTLRTGPPAPYLYRRGIAHLLESGKPGAALALLTDFDYLMDRLRTLPDPDAVEGLGDDWRAVLRQVPIQDRKTRLWEAFFREREHILRRGAWRWPAYKILLQLAVEHADDSPVTLAAERWLESGACDWVWLSQARRPRTVLVDPCTMTFEGHTTYVAGAIEVSPTRVASWSGDGTLRLWDMATGVEVMQTMEYGADIIASATALSGHRFVTGANDGRLRIWNSMTGDLLQTIHAHRNHIAGIKRLAGGRMLSWTCFDEYWASETFRDQGDDSGAIENTLKIWDESSGELLHTLVGHSGGIEQVWPLANGNLVSWSRDMSMRFWDGSNGICLAILPAPDPTVMQLVVDRGLAITWNSQNTSDTRVFVIRYENPLAAFTLDGHTARVDGVRVVGTQTLVSWSEDQTLRVWDIDTGELRHILTGHTGAVSGAIAAPDQKLLSYSTDGTLRLWDFRTGDAVGVLTGHDGEILGAALLSNGAILSWSRDGTLRLWNSRVAPSSALPEDFILQGESPTFVTSDCILLDTVRGKELRDPLDGTLIACLDKQMGSQLQGATVMPNAKIVTWSLDNDLHVWDGRRGTLDFLLNGHTDRINGVASLPFARFLSWSQDGTMRIWNSEAGSMVAVLSGSSAGITEVRVFNGGIAMVRAGIRTGVSDTEEITLWDIDRAIVLAVLPAWVWGACHCLVGDRSSASIAGQLKAEANRRELVVWNNKQSDISPKSVLKGPLGQTLRLEDSMPAVRSVSGWLIEEEMLLDALDIDDSEALDVSLVGGNYLLSTQPDHPAPHRLWCRENYVSCRDIQGLPNWTPKGAVLLDQRRLLVWYWGWTASGLGYHTSAEDVFYVVDVETGVCLTSALKSPDLAFLDQLGLARWAALEYPSGISGNTASWIHGRSAGIVVTTDGAAGIVRWEGRYRWETVALSGSGRLVVGRDTGQMTCLELYRGRRRIALDEYEHGCIKPDGRDLTATTPAED